MFEKNFLGKSGFIWWVGTVENNADPLGFGRCQVRIFGFHGDPNDPTTKQNIPLSDLPWAHPVLPLNNSNTFSTPQLKDWVVGFFMDGDSAQMPVMLGVLPGFYNGG
jgi:hypothetical protein